MPLSQAQRCEVPLYTYLREPLFLTSSTLLFHSCTASSRLPPPSTVPPQPSRCTLLLPLLVQLGCSLAIILIVRNSLYRVSINQVGNQLLWNTQCLAATAAFPGTCE